MREELDQPVLEVSTQLRKALGERTKLLMEMARAAQPAVEAAIQAQYPDRKILSIRIWEPSDRWEDLEDGMLEDPSFNVELSGHSFESYSSLTHGDWRGTIRYPEAYQEQDTKDKARRERFKKLDYRCPTCNLNHRYRGSWPMHFRCACTRTPAEQAVLDERVAAAKEAFDTLTTTLYRPVNDAELALIKKSGFGGMTAFPTRLPEQPYFYPVTTEAYARQLNEWNIKQYGAGHVLRFQVWSDYLEQFPIQTVGSSEHQELWIPAERLAEFNQYIIPFIEVLD